MDVRTKVMGRMATVTSLPNGWFRVLFDEPVRLNGGLSLREWCVSAERYDTMLKQNKWVKV